MPSGAAPGRLGRTLITGEEIAERVAELGQAIRRDYAGRAPLVVGALKGAVGAVARRGKGRGQDESE